ncbi:MAG TPA: AIM24 family protein [Tepidisphaeraceae bacterium]|nr:AIM24 family protein [Tepidisphaeraceae bacterium]
MIEQTSDNSDSEPDRCPWCAAAVGHDQLSCPACGASLTFTPRRDDSGWIELPPIKDMARLRVGSSTCQIEGSYVPVADFNLAHGDSVYFSSHMMLWRDVELVVQPLVLPQAINRWFSGLQVVISEAAGPGHIALSFDEPGEIIAVPLQPGQSIDVREHAFLAATHQVSYDWAPTGACFYTGSGEDQKPHFATGQYLDRFAAAEKPGLLLLHAGGNAFIRDLRDGEWLLVRPGSFLFKDLSVRMGMHMDLIQRTVGWQQFIWLQLVGPGRVAVQSAYPRVEGHESITGTSGPVPGAWEGRSQGTSRERLTPAITRTGSRSSFAVRAPTPSAARQIVVKLIADAMVDGHVPESAMARITAEAREHGFTEYDVRTLINHVKADAYRKIERTGGHA